MASVAPSRLAALTRLRSVIFQTSYNPTSQRTGAKYLKRRLRGPSMIDYYPQQLSISAINKEFKGLNLIDEDEEQRLQDVEDKKKRGKGAPKKAKSAGRYSSYVFLSPEAHLRFHSRQSPLTKEAVETPYLYRSSSLRVEFLTIRYYHTLSS
jgi:small subunit ribosomal protein S33